MVDTNIAALRSSHARLRALVTPMTEDELTRPAYPTEWTIADVLSHIGSGAVINQRRLEDGLAGRTMPADFAPGVWDVWNAKSPVAKRADGLLADAALLDAFEALPPDDRRTFSTSIGPLTVDFPTFVSMRLNEHVLHTWDVAVAVDPAASIPADVAPLVVDNLERIARFAGKPTGDRMAVTIVTTDVPRTFTVELTPDAVAFGPAAAASEAADVRLSADALIRLVYGRLDPDHTPPTAEGAALDLLRRVFRGV